MPMPTRVASVSIQASGLTGAQAPVKWLTATAQAAVNPAYNQGGMYACHWMMVATAAAAGSANPYFTWYDASLSAGLTASGNGSIFGTSVIGAGSAITGASGYAFLSATGVSCMMGGIQIMQCGSGASGASAYLGYGISGTGGAGPAAGLRFDAQLFWVDGWAL